MKVLTDEMIDKMYPVTYEEGGIYVDWTTNKLKREAAKWARDQYEGSDIQAEGKAGGDLKIEFFRKFGEDSFRGYPLE